MKGKGSRNHWLSFYRNEQQGAILILVLALLLVVVPRMLSSQKVPEAPVLSADKAATEALMAAQQAYRDTAGRKQERRYFEVKGKRQLLAMGFSEDAANRIWNATRNGRRFETYSDLSRETGLDSQSLARMVKHNHFVRQERENTGNNSIVDLNAADTNALKALPGIGSKTAIRIVQYRNKLGGFVSLNQLMEIWYVDTVTLKQLFPRFALSTDLITRLKPGIAPENELSRHPYISKSQAKVLTAWVKQHGSLSKEQFLQMPGFTASERNRLLPYLQF